MANITYSPVSIESLRSLSSPTLTALSNHMTDKANSLNTAIKQLSVKIRTSKDRERYTTKENKTTGPVIAELNTFDIASEAGLSESELFEENPPAKSLEDISTELRAALPESSESVDVSKRNNRTLENLKSKKGSYQTLLQLVNADIDNIILIMKERIENPSLEPVINYTALEASAVASGLPQDDLDRIESHKEFVNTKLITPLKKSKAAVDAFRLQLKGKTDSEDEILFDLVYGPPVSTKGKYILSEDGLYYDSRNGGIPEVALESILFDSWNLNQAPNKGGKGITYDDFNLLDYSNTIFSTEFDEVNDMVRKLYDTDDILQSIEDDKASHIDIVSGQITDLITSGYDVSSSMVTNYKRSIAAIAASYNGSIVKRKKQLQLAGLFGNFIITDNNFPFGSNYILDTIVGSEAEPYITDAKEGWTIIGDDIATLSSNGTVSVYRIIPRIPVNDFSFLNGKGLQPAIDVQNRNLLQSADVNDIIKPYKVKFTKSTSTGTLFLKDFTVSPPSVGDFVHVEGDNDVSALDSFVKSLNDDVVTDGLVVCYNFLKGVVESPSSTSYLLDNEADSSIAMNGKLVATSVSSVFPSGVSIPYLGGTLFDAPLSEAPEPWYDNISKGSYVRLHNNVKDGEVYRGSSKLDDLTYNETGFSLDTWMHVPSLLTGMDESHQFRLILACENTGGGGDLLADVNSSDMDGLKYKDIDKVHGMCIGFRLNDSYVSGTPDLSSLEFSIFPTVSQNNPEGTWGPSVAIAESISGLDPNSPSSKLGLHIQASSVSVKSGNSLVDCSSVFTHLVVDFDYKKDLITIYSDKEVVGSGTLSTAFDTNPGTPLQIPTAITYSEDNPYITSHGAGITDSYIESLHEGTTLPPLGIPIMTPWIIGGGFTDSIKRSPSLESSIGSPTTPLGFMGSNTNSTYYTGALDSSGSVVGQHSPSLGGMKYSGVNRLIPRSGLDGFIGSFKLYSKPLDIKEVEFNYDAQEAFFKNIAT